MYKYLYFVFIISCKDNKVHFYQSVYYLLKYTASVLSLQFNTFWAILTGKSMCVEINLL